MFMMDSLDDQQYQKIQAARLQTDVDLSFVFDTTIWQKDTLIAEFVISGKDQVSILERPLSLEKVLYAANVSDWLSAVAVPVGARFRDVGVAMGSFHQDMGFSEYSAFGPPS